jgi:hypothetical protein
MALVFNTVQTVSIYVDVLSVTSTHCIYTMKYALGKLDREDIFKSTIGNESLHEISDDNGVRIVNFITFKNLSKVQCSHIITLINLLGHLLMERLTIKLTMF